MIFPPKAQLRAYRLSMQISKPDSALILVGHGSTLNPDSSPPTHQHAETIRSRGCFAEVHSCFWKEEPQFHEVRYMTGCQDVYVVPVFISEGYFTQSIIPRELGLDGPVTRKDGVTYKYCDPIGSHHAMTAALLNRARETAPDVPEEETTLIIVGHGTGLNDNSALAAKEQAERLAAQTNYAAVRNSYMEEEPLISKWDEWTTTPNVLVVPFFIADGLHSYQDIPVLLGMETEPTEAASQRSVFRENPRELRGRRLYYASAIGTEPLMADVILEQVAAFDEKHAAA